MTISIFGVYIVHVQFCIAIVQELLFKGPKLEIFGSRVYTQIRTVWVGVLGTRPKNFKILMGLGLNIAIFYFLALLPTALKIF